MCGIAGLIAKRALAEQRFDQFVESAKLMQHRGPDASGVYRHRNVLLIHHRLSIIDLESRANQPFHSASGKFSTVYNGEIYNYRELARSLGLELRTRSDTEVMIESFARDEFNALAQWNGIFAGAIYDQARLKLHLFRDRLGVKPLYVYESDDVLAFASEAKVIFDWLTEMKINYQVLGQFLWYGNCTGEAGFIEGVRKVSPGSILTFDTTDGRLEQERKFWSLEKLEPHSDVSLQEALSETRRLIEQAVRRQLVADVYSQDYYPIEYEKSAAKKGYVVSIEDMCLAMDRMREWNYNLAPVMAYVETCDIKGRGTPAPSPEEVKLLIWANIIHGAKGISWFHYFNPTPSDNLKEMARFLDQITRLTPAVLGIDYAGKVSVEGNKSGRVDVMIKEYDQKIYLFSANLKRKENTVRFNIEGMVPNSQVEVFDESRKISAEVNSFTDNFPKLGVRIYKIKKQSGQ